MNVSLNISQLSGLVDTLISSPSDGQVLTWVNADGKWENKASTVPTAANPTASVGLSAVNGSATTFMRSDAAQALSQAITPTMSGAWIFSAAGAASTPAIKVSGAPYAAGTATTNFPLVYLNNASATASTTLSTAGTVFGVNSHGSADLMNLMVDGASKLLVNSAGAIQLQNGSAAACAIQAPQGVGYGIFFGTNTVNIAFNGSITWTFQSGNLTGGSSIHLGTGAWLSSGGTSILSLWDTNQNVDVGAIRFGQPSAATIAGIIKSAASRSVQLLQFITSAAASLGNVSGGCVHDVFADVSTTHTDGTFDTLDTYTSPANALIINGDKITFDYTLITVSSATATREIKIAFAGITIFDSTALTINGVGSIRIRGTIIRKTSTTCRATVEINVDAGATPVTVQSVVYTPDSTLAALNLTTTNALVLSAAAAGTGAASADIVLVQGTVNIVGFGS